MLGRSSNDSSKKLLISNLCLLAALWTERVSLEISKGASADQVCDLLNQAVQDWPHCVDIWDAYLAYLATDAPESLGSDAADAFRAVAELAVSAAGMQPRGGERLRHRVQAFERARAAAGDETAPLALRAALESHASAAVAGCDSAMKELTSLDPSAPDRLSRAADHAANELSRRQRFEDALAGATGGETPTEDAVVAYLAYLTFEETHGDRALVPLLYERAVAACPTAEDLWLRYGRSIEGGKEPDHAAAATVYGRAVRVCGASGTLWERRLRAVERAGEGDGEDAGQEHADAYAEALNAGISSLGGVAAVVLARADFLRRRAGLTPSARAAEDDGARVMLRDTLRHAWETLGTLFLGEFPAAGDAVTFGLAQYWAECEMRAGDVMGAKEPWEMVLSAGGSKVRHGEWGLGETMVRVCKGRDGEWGVGWNDGERRGDSC